MRRQITHVAGAMGAALAALTLVGCGGSSAQKVELASDPEATDGKALFFTASTTEKLAQQGGNYALELRGVDVERTPRATFDKADYVDARRCVSPPCEWTVVPENATKYEVQVFLIDLRSNEQVGSSQSVEAVWDAPPRPEALKLLIDGKRLPITPLEGSTDDYVDVPAGKLRVEAFWDTDARGTGYEVVISTAEPRKKVYARCSTGTSCLVPSRVPILVDQEVSWEVKVVTSRGQKVASGFKICLIGRA